MPIAWLHSSGLQTDDVIESHVIETTNAVLQPLVFIGRQSWLQITVKQIIFIGATWTYVSFDTQGQSILISTTML